MKHHDFGGEDESGGGEGHGQNEDVDRNSIKGYKPMLKWN